MKLLAFDTSTELLSVAVQREAGGPMWQHGGAAGAQASSTLLPAIETLMAAAGLRYTELDAIVFGRGPGSFTGLRTACAVAQGLAYGAGVPLLPIDTLLAVAEEARLQHAPQASTLQLLAVLDARMGEVYAAPYRWAQGGWTRCGDYSLAAPEQIALAGAQALAGNALALYDARLPAAPRWPAQPSAAALLRLAPALWAQGHVVAASEALPLYIRDKVALTTAERTAAAPATFKP
jgi:tRNA threonylcarbamoyladenosine biosynthesis protein TsaB